MPRTESARFDLSIVIPAFREAGIITHSLTRLADWLDGHDYGGVEVLVVVADSDDGTAELARQQAGRFEHFKVVEPGARAGKGRDVRVGMLEASGHYRIFMDADLATPLHHLDEIHRLTKDNVDLAIAVRNLNEIHHQFKRRVLTEAGNILVQIVLLPGIKDSQCGFKLFREDVAREVFGRQTIIGWGFDLEILAIARLLRYRIVTMQVSDWADPKGENMGLVGDSTRGVAIQTLKDLARIRLKLLLRRYAGRTTTKG